MYRIGAVRVGQYSAWQSLQNGRARASAFAANQALMAAFGSNMFGAQLNNVTGVANLAVQSALAKLQSTQNTGVLQQAGSTLSQSTSSNSSAGSILNTVA